MAASKIAVVYARADKKIRSYVIFDGENESDADLSSVRHLDDESIIFLDRSELAMPDEMQKIIDERVDNG